MPVDLHRTWDATLFPQFALAGKAVLPLATGGTLAHVLAIDYALRPVLTSMGARHIVQGYFLLDTLIASGPEGGVTLDPDAAVALGAIVDGFAGALDRPAALVRTA
jgi:FMN reductase